jgi:hypothetical protein
MYERTDIRAIINIPEQETVWIWVGTACGLSCYRY